MFHSFYSSPLLVKLMSLEIVHFGMLPSIRQWLQKGIWIETSLEIRCINVHVTYQAVQVRMFTHTHTHTCMHINQKLLMHEN